LEKEAEDNTVKSLTKQEEVLQELLASSIERSKNHEEEIGCT